MLYNKKHQCISTTASGLHVFTCKDQWHPPSRSRRSTIFLDAFSELPRSNKLRSIEGKGGKVENETKKNKAEEGFSNSGRPIFLWRNIAHGVSTLAELPKHSWRKHPWTVGGNSPEQAQSDGYSPEPPAEAASSSHRIYWWIVLRPKRFRFRGNNLLCIPTSWQKCISQTLRVKPKLPERQPKKLPCRWAGNRASCRAGAHPPRLLSKDLLEADRDRPSWGILRCHVAWDTLPTVELHVAKSGLMPSILLMTVGGISITHLRRNGVSSAMPAYLSSTGTDSASSFLSWTDLVPTSFPRFGITLLWGTWRGISLIWEKGSRRRADGRNLPAWMAGYSTLFFVAKSKRESNNFAESL